METIRYSILIVLLIILSGQFASAQETNNELEKQSRPFLGLVRAEATPQTILSIDPFLLFNNRLKLNLETQINHNPEKYFILTLNGYYFPEREGEEWQSINGNDYFQKLNGYNIEGAYKQFLRGSSFYWFAGMGYSYYRVKYFAYDYYPYIEDGLQYYEYWGKSIKKNFHQINPNINIGIQWVINNCLFIDFYYGIAYNYSFYSGKKVFSDYGEFGYRGVSPNFGISIGIPLKN